MKWFFRCFLAFLVASLFLGASVAQSITYNFSSFDVPGASQTFPQGINDTGQNVGWSRGTSGDRGYLYNGTTYIDIVYPGATITNLEDLTDAGQTVGIYYDGTYHGFTYDGTTWTSIDYPGASNTYFYGVNEAGQIVGAYEDGSGQHGFLKSDTTYTIIDYPTADYTHAQGINDTGSIVGLYSKGGLIHGFLMSDTTYTSIDYPGAKHTYARDINDRGHIVGEYEVGSKWFGFIYDGSNYTSFDYPGAPNTFIGGINDAGEIIGVYQGSPYHGFIATPDLINYDFTCYYNNGDGDYYSGSFHDYLDYEVGDHIMAFTDENGQPGYYEITGKTPAIDGVTGQVFVDTYYDLESDNFYTPLHAGNVVGDNYLGSERDYLLLDHYILNRFGIGPVGAEEVHYEADVTRAQNVYNRHREPFRTIRLNSLHRCYLLLGTRHPELFDDYL